MALYFKLHKNPTCIICTNISLPSCGLHGARVAVSLQHGGAALGDPAQRVHTFHPHHRGPAESLV